MNYKDVFILAQDKGYEFYMGDIRNNLDLDHEELCIMEMTLIQKWLREEHKIHFDMFQFTKIWSISVQDISDKGYVRSDGSERQSPRTIAVINVEFDTYESALLAGIHHALKLLP